MCFFSCALVSISISCLFCKSLQRENKVMTAPDAPPPTHPHSNLVFVLVISCTYSSAVTWRPSWRRLRRGSELATTSLQADSFRQTKTQHVKVQERKQASDLFGSKRDSISPAAGAARRSFHPSPGWRCHGDSGRASPA